MFVHEWKQPVVVKRPDSCWRGAKCFRFGITRKDALGHVGGSLVKRECVSHESTQEPSWQRSFQRSWQRWYVQTIHQPQFGCKFKTTVFRVHLMIPPQRQKTTGYVVLQGIFYDCAVTTSFVDCQHSAVEKRMSLLLKFTFNLDKALRRPGHCR